MTTALPRMFAAAIVSAGPANPQDTRRTDVWVRRLAFTTCPQAGQVREVFRGSTSTTGTPANPALYPMKGRNWWNAQLGWTRRSSLSNRYPCADALEVFKGNAASGVFGFRDQRFGDARVHIAGELSLLPPPPLQEAFGGFRALGLQPCPQLGVALPQTVQVSAGVDASLGIGGDVGDAKVNAKPIPRIVGRGSGTSTTTAR